MKARFTFTLLSAAIVALLILCAWFTMQIFSTDLSGEYYTAKPSAPGESVSITHEETVKLKDKPQQATRTTAPNPSQSTPPVHSVPQLEFAGIVSRISGDAYKSKPSGARIKLNLKDTILLNDHIETAPASSILITFADKTQLSLGEKTSCIIDEFVLDKSGNTDSAFAMRLLQGVCRVVTGLVTTLSPDRFKVETRMATIGIRGCELAFSSKPEEEKIFILGLGRNESVELSSAEDGSAIRDILTGEKDPNIKTSSIVVMDPGTVVILSKGLGRSVRQVSATELREITVDTSPLKSAAHTPKVNPQSTTFVVTPSRGADGEQTK